MAAGDADSGRDTVVDDTAVAEPPRPRATRTVTDTGSGAAAEVAATVDGWGRPARAEHDLIGQTVGRYRVEARLGAGGMGVVWAALDPALDRKVALKVLPPLAADRRAHLEIRLRREAQALARLEHPNVIAVYDVGVAADSVFVAMQLIDGATLDDYLAAHKPAPARVLALFADAARGLAAAHAAGIVHRDVKPSNLLVDRAGRLYVGDFGLARSAEDGDEPSGDTSLLGADMTRAGAVLGTPVYMAPEQHAGAPATARSDQYSLCIALWEALFGQHPFVTGRWTEEVARAAMRADKLVEPPRRAGVPPRVVRALRRGLRHDPDARWPSMEALGEALVPRSRSAWLVAGGGALGIAGAVALTVALTPAGGEPLATCRAGAERLQPSWPGQRDRLRAAILGAELPGGAIVADRVLALLDERAAHWAALRRDVCRDDRGETPGRRAVLQRCLDEQRVAIEQAVDVMVTGDRTTLARAFAIALGLPEPARCEAPSQAGIEPPSSRIADRVAASVRALERAKALGDAGRWADTEGEVGRVLVDAEAIGYPPLVARALADRGRARQELDRPGSDDDLARAAELATAARDDDTAARAYLGLFHDAVMRGDAARVATLRPIARGAIARADDARLRYEFDLDDGTALINEAHYPEAAARCAEVFAAPPGQIFEGTRVRATACATGAYLMQGDLAHAAEWADKGVVTSDALYGPGTYNATTALDTLARVQRARGDIDGALATMAQVIALMVPVMGEDTVDVAIARMTQAQMLNQARRFEEGIPIAKAALAVFERRAAGRSRVPGALSTLGQLQRNDDDLEGAAASYARALAEGEKVMVADDSNLAIIRFQYGGLLAERGDFERADALLAAAEATFRAHQDPRATVVNATRGEMLAEHGRHAEAIPRFEAAIAGMEAAGIGGFNLLVTRVHLAQSRWEANQGRALARTTVIALRADASKLGPPGRELAAELDAWLRTHR